MIEFIKDFLYQGFVSGDYTYGAVHISSILILLVSIILFIYFNNGKTTEEIHKKLRVLAIITLSIYILNRVVKVYMGAPIIQTFWPFYICNVNTIFLAIYLIFNIKKGKDFFIITGMSGAALMFVVPEGVFNDKYLTLQILDSLLSHYFIIFAPFVLLATKAYVLDIKRSLFVIIGLLLVAFNVEVLQPFLVHEEVDYLFIDGTLPFTVKGVHQFWIMLFSATLFVYIIYGLDYLYLSYKQIFNIEEKTITS